MATKTAFLNLILPSNGEYQNIWDGPLNQNFSAIDSFASSFGQEMIDARGNLGSLSDLLSVSIDSNGNLLATPEVVNARNSFSYGNSQAGLPLTLGQRLNLTDREVFNAREGSATLRDALAARQFASPNQVIKGPADTNGYPTYLGYTGAQAQINGSVTNILLMIGGYLCRIRTAMTLQISGAATTYYIYAQYVTTGQTVYDGDSSVAPPSSANGVTTNDGNSLCTLLYDSTINWTTQNVKAGDVLRILGNTGNAGDYMITAVAPSGNNNALQIAGVFPAGPMASLNYLVIDPMAITLGFDSNGNQSNRIYLGEADFDGTSITAVRARNFKQNFTSEWRAIDTTQGGGIVEQIFNHNFGTANIDVEVQVSIANDGSQPVEMLSFGNVTNNLVLNFNNTLTFNPGSFSQGTWNAGSAGSSGATLPTYSPLPSAVAPSLGGSVTANLQGSINMNHSVAMKITRNQIYIKNLQPSLLFTDYSGTNQSTGFIRIMVRKRS